MKLSTVLVLNLLILAAVPAAPAVALQDDGQANENISAQERLLRALDLPRTTREARRAGVEEEELGKVLRTGRERSIPPGELDIILEEEVEAVREHGPIENFGAFVQSRLEQGLRGRELAAAIRAEHAARGKGKAGGRNTRDKMKKSKAAGEPGAAGAEAGERSGKGKAKRKNGAEKEDDR